MQFGVYDLLKRNIEGSSAGTLSNDSSNIVELVKAQYQAITSSIEMKHNATSAVKITFFSSCVDGDYQETNKCSGLRVGSQVQFTAKIEVLECPTDPRKWREIIEIYPVGINEKVLIDLTMMCQCDCEKPGNEVSLLLQIIKGGKCRKWCQCHLLPSSCLFQGYEENSAHCSYHGTYMCGICKCASDYFGRKCECSADNLNFRGDLESGCRPDNTTSTLCNNRGDCICGKCECLKRFDPQEIVSGEFCECDNFSCDRHNGVLCSGPEHGECVCGKCQCKPEWDVPGYTACECLASNQTCITTYGEHIGKLCSGQGTCECGECKCFEREEGQYSGQFCQDCPVSIYLLLL